MAGKKVWDTFEWPMPVTDGSLESSATPMTPYRVEDDSRDYVKEFGEDQIRKGKSSEQESDRLSATIGKNKHLSLHLTTSHVIDECALAGT